MVDQTQDWIKPRWRLFRRSGRIAETEDGDACVRSRSRLLASRPIRFLIGVIAVLGFLLILGFAATAVFWARLADGPIYFEGLGPKIAAALSDRIGGDFTVSVGATIVGRGVNGPALSIDGFSIVSSTGQVVLAAPKAEVDVDAFGLMFGHVLPARLELIGLETRLLVLENGAVAISAGTQPIVLAGPKETTDQPPSTDDGSASTADPTAAPPVRTESAAGPGEMKALAAALRSLLDLSTSPDSPLAALQRFGITDGRLILDDRLRGRTATFEQLDVDFARKGGRATVKLSTDGSGGRWRINAEASGTPGSPRALSVDLADISLDDISTLTGQHPPIDFDMPISAHFDFSLASGGSLSAASARLNLGAGYVYFKDPDAEPFQIDEINSSVRWNVESRRFEIVNAQILSDQTQFNLSGSVTPIEDQSGWQIDLQGSPDDQVGADRPGDQPISITHLLASARLSPAAHSLSIEKLEVAGPKVSLAFHIDVGWDEGSPTLQMRGAAGRMGARELIRLWPASIAAGTRGWFIDHLRGGTVESGTLFVDFGQQAFEAMKSGHSVPDDSSLVEFQLSDASASFLPGVPPLSGIDGTGRITGKTASFNAKRGALDAGRNRKLTLSDLTFVVQDLDPGAARAQINGHVSGSLDSVADLLSRDALKSFGGLPIDPGVARGQADGLVSIDLKMDKNARGPDTSVKVAATVANFSFDKLIGKEKLDQGTLTVTADKTGMKATGQGRMFGAPATIEMKRQGTGPAESSISVLLDDAARAKQGWPTGPTMTGPVAAKFTTDLSKPDVSHAQVEVDLTRASIDGLLPGYSKPAGKSAKATFVVSADGDTAKLDQFAFDGGGGVTLAGVINLDPNGNFANAKFSQVRLSTGDDMKVDVEQANGVIKLVVRAASIDVRPFLKKATGAEGTSSREATPPREIDLDLKSTVLTGNNRQAVTNAEIKYLGHGVSMRQFSLVGRIGRAQVVGQLTRNAGGAPPTVTVSSMDGGALLSFLDLYRRMEGGNLSMAGQVQGDRIDGYIHVLDFVVRDEPGLRRLVAEGSAQREANGGPIDTSIVQFSKMQVNFSRSPSRLDLRDGVIYGQQIGISIDGSIDYARDRVGLTGTFVPAYGLNNLFAQIPLVGPIIGGGSHEGLFAVNFQIGGAASAPVLQINPLSAIAPGFLRKIFGAIPNIQQPPPAPIPDRTPTMPMAINPAR